MRRLALLLLFLCTMALTIVPPVRADQGWVIERFHAEIQVEPDTSLRITESLDVDFNSLEKHGIFREIPVVYDYNQTHNRIYKLTVERVTNAGGSAWPYTVERNGANEQIRIGDPDRTVSGKQTYRITYRVRGALNAFDDHDELFWNVNGRDWDVPFREVSASVLLAGGGLASATCFQGTLGSLQPCDLAAGTERIEYRATAPLAAGEELTLVAAVRKGVLPAPELFLEQRPRTFPEYFEVSPGTIGATLLVLFGGLALLARTWWSAGRDRRYTTLFHLTANPAEETRPLFKGEPVVVEYQPPEGLHPAEMGLLIDERVDTLDLTATIVDLAVRGYLSIEEIPKKGLFGKKDWKLTQKRRDWAGLAPYEVVLLEGLFKDREEVTLSGLKNTFHSTLQKAQAALYTDAVRRGWFSGNPKTSRNVWAGVALGVVLAGAGLAFVLGQFVGAGFVGIVVILLGLLLLVTARTMPRRTAAGAELLRRTRGFREYIATAETDRQRFNETQNIFAAYLPYAIVFGLVDRWANTFRSMDMTTATTGWYYGIGGFDAPHFSSDISSFASQVSSTIASTPGGSGGSGFSGGAGGGGGGGGGGSW